MITQRKREEVPIEYRWCLEDIFPSDTAWHEEYTAIESLAEKYTQHSGKLTSAENLKACLQAGEELDNRLEHLHLYSFLKGDEDTANPTYTAMREKADALLARVGAATSFFTPELLAIPPSQVTQWLEGDAELAAYKHWYHDVHRQRAHVLSKEIEELLALVSEVTDAPATIFQMLETADMRFGQVVDEDGNALELTHARYANLMRSTNREVRRRSYEAYNAAFAAHKHTLSATLSAWVRRSSFYAKVRGYAGAQSAAMSPDDIPEAVYSSLVSTIRQNIPTLHRYMAMRKRALGVDTLEPYDILAPLVPAAQIKVSWEQAKEWVLAALEPLGAEYVGTVRTAFDQRWIDVFENEGKSSGAYCASKYGLHPYVLLNYADTLDDVFTLAHEVGHMMHSHLTNTTQPYVYSGYSIFVAEVASTLNEALLMDYLLKTLDKEARAALINEALEGFRGTIFRQVQFAEFEKAIYDMQQRGDGLAYDDMAKVYSRLQAEYHGEQLTPSEYTPNEWMRIPHFYYNFYVYQYATGKSAAESLARGLLHGSPGERSSRLEAYLGFLRSGSSAYSIELLQRAGVDMTSPKPVQDACTEFERLLDEMEAHL